MTFTQLTWWMLAITIVYVYAGYPLLLLLLNSAKKDKPMHIQMQTKAPSVTLLISAYNEEAIIAEKLRNCLALDYPREIFQVIVVSDCSNDETDEIVQSFESKSIRLLRMPERGGKTLGLNEAVRIATGKVVVFSDANAMYRPDAIRNLVSNFSDPKIGAVVGESKYADVSGRAEESESLYWAYETAIKRLESAIGSVVGGDGAIYAIRKTLYRPMPADSLSDFVNPLQIVEQGYRCVYEPAAVSFEKASGSFLKEYRRKVRIVNRAWRGLFSMSQLLNPMKFGILSMELISHKLLRWMIPVFLMGLLVTSARLAVYNFSFAAFLVMQITFYVLAAVGFALRENPSASRIFSVPFYFTLVNVASAQGILDVYLGKTYTTWSTPRASQ